MILLKFKIICIKTENENKEHKYLMNQMSYKSSISSSIEESLQVLGE